MVPNTLMYDVSLYDYCGVLYTTLIFTALFYCIKQCSILTMHGGSAIAF